MKISYLKEKLILTAAYFAAVALLAYLGVSCLSLTFLHIPCPGCGMTRAWLAALRLDFGAAFAYHPMFWSMPILYAYFLLDHGILASKRLNKLVLWSICIGFIIQWIAKIVEY